MINDLGDNILDVMKRVPPGSRIHTSEAEPPAPDGTWHVEVKIPGFPTVGEGEGKTMADGLAIALDKAERGEG